MDQQNYGSQTSDDKWRNEQRMDADVLFLVGGGTGTGKQQLIPAHKYILSFVSGVFKDQFMRFTEISGDTKEKPIEVPDVHPDAFRAMLCYIYANDLSGVNKQNILAVYYAGKKYMINALVKKCRLLLMNCHEYLGVDNMFAVLKHAQRHGDKELISFCWAFVDENILSLRFHNEKIAELDQADLCELFSRDTLAVANELICFFLLLYWAICKCEATGLELTPENLRRTAGEAIYQIRFPLITEKNFTKLIVPSDMLTHADIIAMYVHYNNTNNCCGAVGAQSKYPNRFNSQPRASSKGCGEKRKLDRSH